MFCLQVLHLMNKMNLPAPFRMALPTPPLPSQVPAPPPPPPPPQPSAANKPHLTDLSSDESELESSDVHATSSFIVFHLVVSLPF
jgi:U11/U12 small nuclear ribonucleoprotein SNRNP65